MYQVELTLLQLEVIQELLEKDTYFDKSYKKRINDALSNGRIIKPSCPAPVLVPSLDKSGAPLYLHASLDESVTSASVLTCDCGSTFYRDDLGSCYDCYFPSDSRDGE